MNLISELYPRLDEGTASAAETLLAALRAAQAARHVEDKTWPLRADDWLAEIAVDAAVRGSTSACLSR